MSEDLERLARDDIHAARKLATSDQKAEVLSRLALTEILIEVNTQLKDITTEVKKLRSAIERSRLR